MDDRGDRANSAGAGQDPLAMTVPGTVEAAAERVKAVSPEGRPAPSDAKSGPGRIAVQLGVVALTVIAVSLGVGWWFGLYAGLACMAIGAVALFFNPVFGAAIARAGDRSEAIHRSRT